MKLTNFDKLMHKLQSVKGRMVGEPYTIYRPTNFIDDILSNANIIDTRDAFFSIKSKNPTLAIPLFECGIQGDDLKQGDILINDDEDRIFVLTQRELQSPWNAVQTNQYISVFVHDEYRNDTNGEWGANTKLIADNIPAYVSATSPEEVSNSFSNYDSYRSYSQVYHFVFYYPNKIELNDIIELNDDQFSIKSGGMTPWGYSFLAVKL